MSISLKHSDTTEETVIPAELRFTSRAVRREVDVGRASLRASRHRHSARTEPAFPACRETHSTSLGCRSTRERVSREDRVVKDQGLGLAPENLRGQPVGGAQRDRAIGLCAFDTLERLLELSYGVACRLSVA